MGNRVSSLGDTRLITVGLNGTLRHNKSTHPDGRVYTNNEIVTSKYTWWNFLPLNMFEQFRRIANFYFLIMVIIMLVSDSPVSPVTSILPLVFVIMVTAVKQAYEDLNRHRMDREVNQALYEVVRNGCVQEIRAANIMVGDVVRVTSNSDIPCDLVLLSSSDPEGKCFLTTANLDGETNLKTLTCPKLLRQFSIPEELSRLGIRIECENPTPDLYSFHGRLEILCGVETPTESTIPPGHEPFDPNIIPLPIASKFVPAHKRSASNPASLPVKYPNDGGSFGRKFFTLGRSEGFPESFALERLGESFRYIDEEGSAPELRKHAQLRRQSTQRASWLIKRVPSSPAVVANGTLQKQRTSSYSLSAHLSPQNILLRGARLKNTDHIFGCAIYTGYETKLALNSKLTRNKFSSIEKSINKFLLFFIGIFVMGIIVSTVLKNVFDIRNPGMSVYLGRVPHIDVASVFQDVASFLILYNYLIPISLYVTIELQKFIGSIFFEWDIEIFYENANQRATCNTSDLNEELGQIQFLFSDKTGTLTENEMHFRRCSLNGVCLVEAASGHLVRLPQDGDERRSIRSFRKSMRKKKNIQKKFQNNLIDNNENENREIDNNNRNRNNDENYLNEEGSNSPPIIDEEEDLNEEKPTFNTSMNRFLLAFALCHNIQVEGIKPPLFDEEDESLNNNLVSVNNLTETSSTNPLTTEEIWANSIETSDLIYQASSPDEKALVEVANRCGVSYLGERNDFLYILNQGNLERFHRLEELEFTSSRRRMSVIVEDEEGCIWLFCKGAESSVIPLCNSGPINETLKHVSEFAIRGLRTLVVGYRKIERNEYIAQREALEAAKQQVGSATRRDSEMARTYKLIEDNLHLLGATGVEDRLQDGVPETLEALRAAGIKVWILTGDKVETAVNISFSCGHFKFGTKQLYLTGQLSEDDCLKKLEFLQKEILSEPNGQFGLVADGESIAVAIRSSPDVLRAVFLAATSVICCRMSPLQKSEVVQLIKKGPQKPVTAAIGDGANDVSMIQEAHVGIGILGKEGRQAARCSDFALGRFKFIRRVLLVHGHWYYTRLATLIQYSFYKNIVFILPQFYFAGFSLFSSQAFYDSLYLSVYNLFFTSLPILIYGLFEQNYSADKLMDYPQLYMKIKENRLMSWKTFIIWFIQGLWHSIVVFFLPYAFVQDNCLVLNDASCIDLWTFSTFVTHCVVWVVNLKILFHSRYWTLIYVLASLGSILFFMLFSLVYSAIFIPNMESPMYWVYFKILISPTLWLISFLVIVVSLVPDFAFEYLKPSWRKIVRKLSSSYLSETTRNFQMSQISRVSVRRRQSSQSTRNENSTLRLTIIQ